MFDWIAYLVAIGITILIGYAVFYPMFEEWGNNFWEEIERIKSKTRRNRKE